jgi:hypothetical protein
MELFDNLASVGITVRLMQIAITSAFFLAAAGGLIYLVGKFWKMIVTGLAIVFCMVVFAMPNKEPVVQTKEVKPQDYKIEPMPLQPPVIEVKPDSDETKEQADERMFLEDCKLHSGYTADKCNSLWSENKAEIEKSAWRYKHDKSYMRKVKYASR